MFYGRRRSIPWQKAIQRKRRYPLIIFWTVNPQRKKQISIYIHPKRKDYIIQLKGSVQATQAALAHTMAQCNPTVERGPKGQASEKLTEKDKSH